MVVQTLESTRDTIVKGGGPQEEVKKKGKKLMSTTLLSIIEKSVIATQ